METLNLLLCSLVILVIGYIGRNILQNPVLVGATYEY
jgi:hypothetical protein